MSQSIALGNVSTTNFNGSAVQKINLNGAQIWSGLFTQQMTVGSWSTDDKIPLSDYGFGYNFFNDGAMYGYLADLTPQGLNGAEVYDVSDGGLSGYTTLGTLSLEVGVQGGVMGVNDFSKMVLNGREWNTHGTPVASTDQPTILAGSTTVGYSSGQQIIDGVVYSTYHWAYDVLNGGQANPQDCYLGRQLGNVQTVIGAVGAQVGLSFQ